MYFKGGYIVCGYYEYIYTTIAKMMPGGWPPQGPPMPNLPSFPYPPQPFNPALVPPFPPPQFPVAFPYPPAQFAPIIPGQFVPVIPYAPPLIVHNEVPAQPPPKPGTQ